MEPIGTIIAVNKKLKYHNRMKTTRILFCTAIAAVLSILFSCTDSTAIERKSNQLIKGQEPLAQQSIGGCDDKLWSFVYDPKRLNILDKCKTVTGVVVERNADPDGDEHMLLKLDAGQEKLLEKRNYTKKDGNLVIEAVCINHITRKKAKGICKGYVNNVKLPNIGDHVRVTGSYVLDSHNGWTEIHPISKIVAF
jgi:hypothetical protein